jgi:pantoate--beta-alanine ligase
MNIFQDLDEWRHFRQTLPTHLSIGFIPTMGYLHDGHASLYQISQRENDRTIASIFVNPKQFNEQDDFIHYPRSPDADLELLERNGVSDCFLPTDQAMYMSGDHYQIQETQRSLLMEGQHRPGHFTGVLTIVMKLLHLVKPHRAYFGEKDHQQLELIRGMVRSFFMDIDIISCPIVREASGLPYSSRNSRLTPEQRKIAEQFAHIFHQKAVPIEQTISKLHDLGIDIDYLEEHNGRRFIAVRIGNIRIIDNDQITHL